MSEPASPLLRTPLWNRHQALGARLIDFGGWSMPVQYSGILDEHRAVRSAAGLFDVSHMGEVTFRGPRAQEAVQRVVTNDVGRLTDGSALYTVMCHPHGGIVDDCIVYRERADSLLIVVNASNRHKDVAWFHEHCAALCSVTDESDATGLLAVQGPRAIAVVERLAGRSLAGCPSFHFCDFAWSGTTVRAARTGYTGEDGFELFVPAERAAELWDALLDAGQPDGLRPIGLGARDTLRLEARLSLYGNDLDDTTSPLEAGLGWVVKGRGYLGQEALDRQRAAGLPRKLVGFVMTERAIARHGYPIVDAGGAPIGVVTSGAPGPTVGKNLGLGYVPVALSEPGTVLTIDVRGKRAQAEVVKGPFYRRAT
jgi:aminomethyltransferase